MAMVPLLAAAAGQPPAGDLVAARASGKIEVDGRLDERAWRSATPFADFVELYPDEGATPSERTEVRFLYDDDQLYVGIVCHDSQPQRISRAMGRRDHIPPSDSVAVAIDSAHDHRTGYYFILNAAGVQEDRLLHDDTGETDEWDAVWDGAAAPLSDGWSAEIAIPLRVLRFERSDPLVFGVYVQRKITRTHAVIASTLIPLGAGAFVSQFGQLKMGAVEPQRDLELMPFLAARFTMRPELSGAAVPRVGDPSADVGLDFRAPLSRGVGVTGTVNPDFGQVEADPVILNLTRFESFFPEKRPFFMAGMDLFQPVGGESGSVPHQILYSRRIGSDAPILAAAKVGGDLAPGLQVGLVEAFVAGASAPSWSGTGSDRRLGVRWAQPLHLARNDTLPAVAPTPENFFAAVARRSLGTRSWLGLAGALATPVGPRCSDGDVQLDAPPASCDARGGNAAAAQWDLRSTQSEYGFAGQVAVSQVVGGPPVRTLGDGTSLRRGDAGFGVYATAGKVGGEPWRAWVAYELATPRLDLNAAGYQPDQNLHDLRPALAFVRESGLGPLHRLSAEVSVPASWSADGSALRRRAAIRSSVSATLPGYNDVSCDGGYEAATWDLREIYALGIPYRRPASFDAGCSLSSDTHRALALGLSGGFARVLATEGLPGARAWQVGASAVLRPSPALETRLGLDASGDPIPGRFLEEDGGELRFGDLAARSLSLTLREQVVATPRLSFIGYLQVFTVEGRYQAYYAAAPSTRIDARDLRPVEVPSPGADFRSVSLRLNLVVRWEYRPGSTVFVVYSRSQEGDTALSGGGVAGLLPARLGPAPATDVFLVKWSHWTRI
ncbi:carbohydrate binding family 9 domain-containing protein [Anaeromyxobacter terrae]|uniref:carbohydrate binding family 9 domain-containing protein n=1 Tax=Anaeromyxobacter terrae TaxID=2925406 RepID=UPI001F58318C|nr:carbohydrate binding family 9 domain-containing protein [Anaeromyxobacter sp. SG22]